MEQHIHLNFLIITSNRHPLTIIFLVNVITSKLKYRKKNSDNIVDIIIHMYNTVNRRLYDSFISIVLFVNYS